jgi:putative ABC transport system substrate-binding protein
VPLAPSSRRRFFVGLMALLAAPGGAAAAPAPRPARLGVLSPFSGVEDAFLAELETGLREAGYAPGRDIVIEYRAAGGVVERLQGLAAELVRRRVDVIVTTTTPGLQAARQATGVIPIVVGGVDDAVGQGFVASLAQPGGNITGSSWFSTELSAKRVELLKEAFPAAARVAVLREAVGGATALRATEAAARRLGLGLHVFELRQQGELDSAFAAILQERAAALLVLSGPMLDSHVAEIVRLAARHHLPAVFPDDRFVRAGGLMSYGPRLSELYRRAARYVDRILKGARPGALPVEQPTRFDLVVNLRTAQALGPKIAPSILLRADDVIR